MADRRKVAFRRTPKVSNRTTAPMLFNLAPYALVGLSVYTIVNDISGQRWMNLVYASINAALGAYAIVAFIGVGNSLVDVWMNILSLLQRPEKSRRLRRAAPAHVTGAQPVTDWAAVLHYGSDSPNHAPLITPTPAAVRPAEGGGRPSTVRSPG